jgi:hypothetical protein
MYVCMCSLLSKRTPLPLSLGESRIKGNQGIVRGGEGVAQGATIRGRGRDSRERHLRDVVVKVT